MPTTTRLCPAKINLTLRVSGVRPDGFHEIESLVALVGLHDTLVTTPQEDGRYALTCDDATLPDDGSNLVLQAARALARHAGTNRGADFVLHKRIPAGSGLGGGSSNAAAALDVLNQAWDVRASREQLAALGAAIGSDVPLFLHGPLCVLRGRGEVVERLDARCTAWCTLILPPIHCATPAVYKACDRLPRPVRGAALDDVVGALSDPARLMTLLFNDLEPAAFEVAPTLAELAARATRLAGGPVRMSGSGSALFRLFASEAEAIRFAAIAREDAANRGAAIRCEAVPVVGAGVA